MCGVRGLFVSRVVGLLWVFVWVGELSLRAWVLGCGGRLRGLYRGLGGHVHVINIVGVRRAPTACMVCAEIWVDASA
jgi:hypothetical protein